jgi:hypothetical protein
VKTALNAAKAGAALVAMSLAFSAAAIAAPDEKTPPMTLVSTDTSGLYPFAAIDVNHTVYHVTEGDLLNGVYIRHIVAGHVTLSTDQVLTTGRPLQPDAAASQQAQAANRSRAQTTGNR